MKKHKQNRFVELILMFLFSGTVYMCIELIYRQYTSISMGVLGGLCGLFIMLLNDFYTYGMDYLLQGFLSSVFITCSEFLCGQIVNQNYTIWDYRHLPFNIDGQICLPFMLIWLVLALVFIPILDWIEWKVFDYMPGTPPYYKVFGKKIYQFKAKTE